MPNQPSIPVTIRPMGEKDLEQVSAVEKDAFPDLFPSTAFAKELKHGSSVFLVAELDESKREASRFLPNRWAPYKTKDCGNPNNNVYRNKYTGWVSGQRFIIGILGLWNMANEGHIVTLAVRRYYRRLGVGETILYHCLKVCLEKSLLNVTLEVRSSNKEAQFLYRKYGFNPVGVRKGYYTDNGEDAMIMTTANTDSCEYLQILRKHCNNTGQYSPK